MRPGLTARLGGQEALIWGEPEEIAVFVSQ